MTSELETECHTSMSEMYLDMKGCKMSQRSQQFF